MLTESQAVDWPLTRTRPTSPPPAYAALREGSPRPVRPADGGLAWLLSRHADVRHALLDPRFSSDDDRPGFPSRCRVPRDRNMNSFWRMDEPRHGHERHMVMPDFTSRKIKEMRPVIGRLIDELLDAVAAGPCPADLFADFCLALPTMVIARMLGVPAEDYRWFSEQSRLCLALDSPERSVTAYAEINAYLHRLAQAKESEPADDLISRVINDYVAIGLLDRDDLVPLVRLVLIAGFETTSNQSR